MISSFFNLKELERWSELIVVGISTIFPIFRVIAVVDPAFPNIERMKDFFISYTKADQVWAEWIAWILEEVGLSVIIQAWDFRPGGNFILDMQRAASLAEKTIVVLSPAYLQSEYAQPEWAAAFAQDPQGKARKLIPVRIAKCKPTGMLAPIIYVDLLGLPQDDARAVLLGAFSERSKPSCMPAFPGAQSPDVSAAQPAAYPGTTNATSTPIAEILSTVVESANHSRRLSASQRLQFIEQLNAILPQHFNMLLFAVNPPAGLIPPMPVAQGDRTIALLIWAEGHGGCGLSVLQELLDKIITPSPFGNVEQSNPNAPAARAASSISSSPVQTESPAVSSKIEYHRPTSDLTLDQYTPALAPQRLSIREKSAAEILGNLKGVTLSYQFHEKVKELYFGRWTREPGWQTTVYQLPSKLSGGLWGCSFREVGSGTLVMATTVQDVSTLRPGDSVTVSGRISDVSLLESVSLEDAVVRGEHVSPP